MKKNAAGGIIGHPKAPSAFALPYELPRKVETPGGKTTQNQIVSNATVFEPLETKAQGIIPHFSFSEFKGTMFWL